MKRSILPIIALICLVSGSTNAAVPQLINYQGALADSTGAGLDTTVNIKFSIYDAAVSGSLLWTETQGGIIVTGGLFNVLLGSVSPLDVLIFASPIRYLGITIGADPEITPRSQLVSVPYSFNSEHATEADLATYADSAGAADILDSLSSEDFSRKSHSHSGGNGGWTDDGNSVRLETGTDSVGIGTSTPTAKLDVAGDVIVSGKATIGPGHTNTGANAFIAGANNTASGGIAIVGGGENNTASGFASTVGGGRSNSATASNTTIAGGQSDTANGVYSGVSSGFSNLAGASVLDTGAFVGGGANNSAPEKFATVSGGFQNTASGDYSTVGGGFGNAADTIYTTVSGGRDNTASGVHSTVGGGNSNTASGYGATVSGGSINAAITSSYATVGGGRGDTASGYASTVGGGQSNTASNTYSTVSGGQGNTANGLASTVGGGIDNEALGHYSFAAGRRAKATGTGTFVWGDSYDGDVSSSLANQFTVRASGGVRFFSDTALTTGVTLSPGGGAWVTVSDSAVKRNIRPVDEFDILEKVASLPISRWSYETQSPDIEHIGPMAQDFYATFGVGEDEKGISTLDPDGVALAAIQALYKENQELKRRLLKLEEQVKLLTD